MFTKHKVLSIIQKMFRHDNILLYGHTETFGLYKNSRNRIIYFSIPTREAQQLSGRKIVARKLFTDFRYRSQHLKELSLQQFLAGTIRLGTKPEIYRGNRTSRYGHIVQSMENL